MPRRQQTHELRSKNAPTGGDKWTSGIKGSRETSLTWADCDAEDLLAALVAVTEDGAALLLSKTSDGGALAVHVLTGTNTHKLYPAHMNELTAALSLIREIAESS